MRTARPTKRRGSSPPRPVVPEEHRVLKRELLAKFGTARNIAKATGKSIQTVSGWGRTHVIPAPWPGIFQSWLAGTSFTPQTTEDPWDSEEWQREHGKEQAQQQIERLWNRTLGRGREWESVMSVLALVEPWKPKDWRLVFERQMTGGQGT